MVNDKYSVRFKLNKNKLFNFADKTGNSLIKNADRRHISEFFFRLTKIPYYISKVRILKFQKWVVIYFYLYKYFFINKKKIKIPDFVNAIKLQKKNSLYFLKKNNNILNFF